VQKKKEKEKKRADEVNGGARSKGLSQTQISLLSKP